MRSGLSGVGFVAGIWLIGEDYDWLHCWLGALKVRQT
mgnify:CR=1 FL=1